MGRHKSDDMGKQKKSRSDDEIYRFLPENSSDILWTIDQDYRLKYISDSIEGIARVKASDMIGKFVLDLVAPEYHAIFNDKLKKQLNAEAIPPYEVAVIDAYGGRIPFEIKTSPIVNDKNEIVGIQGVSRELKERKRMADAARKSEEKFRDLVENTYDWVWEADKNVIFTYSNPRVKDYLGYAPEEVVGKSIYSFMDPVWAKKLSMIMDKMIKERKTYAMVEKTLVSKSGESVPFEMTVTQTFDENGVLKGYRGICRDIRDRKLAEEAQRKAYGELEKMVEERTKELVNARATLQCILETAPICIIVVDAITNMITFYSPGSGNIFGDSLSWSKYEMNEGSFRFLLPNRSPFPKGELPITLSLKFGKQVSEKEILVMWGEGSESTILMSSAPIKDPEGNITAAVATVVDITRLKTTERALQEAKGQAEMYLDLMGHDINNLNQAGIGYLELALDKMRSTGKLDIRDQLLLDKAMETQINSSKLIDKVRKLRRSKEGEIKNKIIDLCDIIMALKVYYSHIPDRRVTIEFTPVEGCYVNANELIEDVFSNLIGNAVKHSSPEEPLEIDIGIKKVTEDNKLFFEIYIEDNGPGIPDELKGRLFIRFQKGDTITSGRGLGLYLVKTLLEDINGSVRVEDRVKGDYGKGSRFVIRLPVASTMPNGDKDSSRSAT